MSSTSRPSTPIPSTPTISHPAYNLLARAHDSTTASTIFTDKLKNKPLLLQPSTTLNQDKRSLRRHVRLRKKQYHIQHQKPRPLSAKEKRQLQIYDLKPEEIKYDIYKRLNEMWTGYILEVLNLVDKDGEILPDILQGKRQVTAMSAGSLIASADFHGMDIEVVRAKDVGRVGLRGIIVRETRSSLVVVTSGDRCVRVMKSGCVFRVIIDFEAYDAARKTVAKRKEDDAEVEGGNAQEKFSSKQQQQRQDGRRLVLELHGSQLEIRPVERAVRKFKWKSMNYL